MGIRHYISELDLSADEFRALLKRAKQLKTIQQRDELHTPLSNKVLAMIFQKSSTRTRVSFETGMAQLGGQAIFLSPDDTQLGRGEPIEDTAAVLSQMVDAVMIRTSGHHIVECFSRHARVPVINGLSDFLHPCQMLADMQTCFEHLGDMQGRVVAWVGDGNNVCNSYIQTAYLLGFELRIACPEGYEPDANLLEQYGCNTVLTRDPREACDGAQVITTDVWASMGQEEEQQQRAKDLADYQVDQQLMALGDAGALFLHCLPAHRGEEVSAEVIDGEQSHVWEQAGNRLHAQKALLEMLMA